MGMNGGMSRGMSGGMTTPLLIWGAGAIGGTIGAYLAHAGQAVQLVDIEAIHVEAINADGLRIEGPIRDFGVRVPAATPKTLTGQYERILLCVKAHHTEVATRALVPHLAPGGYVASFQNGLNEHVIGNIIGLDRVIGAFVNFGADYMAPGRILYGGRGACVLGEMDGAITPRLSALHDAILAFDPDTITTDDIAGYLWGKLGYGALLFATALTNDSIADVFADPAASAVLAAVGREVMAVAAALHVTPRGFNGFDPAAFTPRGDDAAVARSLRAMEVHNRKSAKSHSGIWRDLAVRHRQTEVDAQLGPIIAEATRLGLAAPLLTKVLAMIHGIEQGRQGLDRANLLKLAT